MIINIKEDLEKRTREWNLNSIIKNMTTKEEQFNSLVHERYTCIKEQDFLFEIANILIEHGVLPETSFTPEIIQYLNYRKECYKEINNNKIYLSYDEGENFDNVILDTTEQDITWEYCMNEGIAVGPFFVETDKEDNVMLKGSPLFNLDNTNVKITDKVEYMGRYIVEIEPVVGKSIELSFNGGESYSTTDFDNLDKDEVSWEYIVDNNITLNGMHVGWADEKIQIEKEPLYTEDKIRVVKSDLVVFGGRYILGE